MAFDKDKPGNNDKLKNSAGDLRDNFTAIQEGEVQHEAVQLTRQGADPAPTTATNAGYFYGLEKTQDDGSTTSTEAHWQDEDGNVTQLTSGGVSPLPKAFGVIDSTGALVAGTGYNVDSGNTSKISTGLYKVSFNQTISGSPTDYVILFTSFAVSTSASDAATYAVSGAAGKTPTASNFHVQIKGADGSSMSNAKFGFVVYHPSALTT